MVYTCGEESIETFRQHYARELPAESIVVLVPPFIFSDLQMEKKTFQISITNQPKEQLKELSTSSMLQTMCPNLSTLAIGCLTLPVGSVSVERSF